VARSALARSRWVGLWLAVVLGWSLIRIALASAYLSDYGVDIRIFALIEVVSSPLLAISTARLVESLVQRASLRILGHGLVALVTFAAPDVYLLASGRGLSWPVYAVIGALIISSSGVSALQLRRSVASARDAATSEPFDNL
jgi:hypothetical protein